MANANTLTNTTSSETRRSNLPSHEMFVVEGEGEKAMWHKVGALWAHNDGEGFNLTIPAGITVSGRLVIRTRKEKANGGE
ncbi:hypothetical protein BB934_45525 (plasmid) [Microvirga ossetica]|uniref:Uncharacterized protein n=1 Tax=Microvirga ossetica TaxID=1882682 RepID=A0A1B2EZX8_9HYPH|nr:hypothetical protein [Microvirga ossetica]ANY85483.1 hypothetical protein BB934_45525 [Microvirga ossetica]